MARARRRWRRDQGKLKVARLVFLDETAVTTKMVRLRGRNRRGERLVIHQRRRIPQEAVGGSLSAVVHVPAGGDRGRKQPSQSLDGDLALRLVRVPQ